MDRHAARDVCDVSFTGRTRALRELVAWLGDDGGGLCVVTGRPGSGKSALLGRLLALADREQRRALAVAALPADTVPPERSIDVAVWAKGLTTADVVEAIAAAIGASADAPDELIDAVLERGRRLVVVVDALDEASGEGEARRIAQRLLKPLAVAGRQSAVKVLVGTRRGHRDELLDALGRDKRLIDLDTSTFLERQDLVVYARRRLAREGEGVTAARTPYRAQPAVAARVARAVADRASPSFLIAHLVSRSLSDAGEVVDTNRRGWESDRRRARDLLTALAYAEGAGLPYGHDDALWPRLASALAGKTYGAVSAVAVGELDGRAVAVSGGEDETVRMWDFAGSQLSVIDVGSPVHAIAARGRTIVLGADAGVMAIEIRVAARAH